MISRGIISKDCLEIHSSWDSLSVFLSSYLCHALDEVIAFSFVLFYSLHGRVFGGESKDGDKAPEVMALVDDRDEVLVPLHLEDSS